MDILIDTNFVLTCVKQELDFARIADEMFNEEITWIVPQDVLNELGNLKDSKGVNARDKKAAELSFVVLQEMKPKIVEIAGKNPNVDIKIVNYLLGEEKMVLATLDVGLKKRVKNKILSIKGKKGLVLA